MRRLLSLAAVVVLVAAPLWAKAARMPLGEMVKASDLIVVAKVTSVRRTLFGKRIATAEVVEAWKGSATRVGFLAEPTWMCDVADAKEGETTVLFLLQEKSRYYFITHSGRGRMPVRETGRGLVADFWPEVWLPEDTPTQEGPDPESPFVRSIELGRLRDLVKMGERVER